MTTPKSPTRPMPGEEPTRRDRDKEPPLRRPEEPDEDNDDYPDEEPGYKRPDDDDDEDDYD